jgi:monovalent cation:H+ antiporter-2, CPA2 family
MAGQTLIATIVIALGLAFVFGAVANRLRTPLLIGYLVAGVVIGPFTPGYVADQALALQLAEVGVILLMFGVGLHFSLHDLLSVRAVAIPGALGQMALVSAIGFGLAHAMGWSTGAGVVFGIALSVASTVVVLRALQERRLIESDLGRIVVGWLIVEDLAMVLVLVLLPAFAPLLGGHALTERDSGWFSGFLESTFDLGSARTDPNEADGLRLSDARGWATTYSLHLTLRSSYRLA